MGSRTDALKVWYRLRRFVGWRNWKYPVYPVGDFYQREDGQWMHDFKVRFWHPVFWWIVLRRIVSRAYRGFGAVKN